MKEFEINIANIQHLNKVTSSNEVFKGLVVSLKYDFLKNGNMFISFENLPINLKEEVSHLFENFDTENHVRGVRHIHSMPMKIGNNERYFIVTEDKKIYDFYKDIEILPTYEFFDWCFALIIVQTPIEKFGNMLDYNLSNIYKGDIVKMENDLNNILLTFKNKYIQHKLEIFHRFNGIEINLFKLYRCDFKNTKNTIKNWLKLKKSKGKYNNAITININETSEKLYKNEKPNLNKKNTIPNIIEPYKLSASYSNVNETINTLHSLLTKSNFINIAIKDFSPHFMNKIEKKDFKKIQWLDSEAKFVRLIDGLKFKGRNYYKGAANHFLNRYGNPFKNTQLATTSAKNTAKHPIIKKILQTINKPKG